MQARQEPCDVQDVIGSALEQLTDRLRGRQITVDLPSALPLVPMDFVLIVQVLVNLIDNASKYSPPASPIEIRAHLADAYLEIQVADTGIGIPVQDLTRVFDKFYRVRRPDGVAGTGLGLSICKGIVELHRGKIRADNREGGGTIVTVDLPVNNPTGRQWSGQHERA
jgi:two-component system sensor histidine kinase KdpD